MCSSYNFVKNVRNGSNYNNLFVFISLCLYIMHAIIFFFNLSIVLIQKYGAFANDYIIS